MNMKKRIEDILMSTNRDGMDKLLQHMDAIGFYFVPCSGAHHLAREGGLAEHSLNVLEYAERLGIAWMGASNYYQSMQNSVIIAALLHDLGKCGDHCKSNYIVNMVKDGRPTKAEPEQKFKQSETKPFITNPDLLYLPHEVRSIAIAERFITLSEDEEYAIAMHNGLYGDFRYVISGKETPLYMILHFADMWASRVVEKEESTNEDN